MSKTFTLFTTTALASTLAVSAAYADVKAEDVWANGEAVIAAYGGKVSVEKSRDGNVVSYGETTAEFNLPFDAGRLGFVMPPVTMTENGDGTVSIGYPDMSVYKFSFEGVDDIAISGAVEMDTSDFTMTASGEAGDVLYEYSADQSTFRLTDLVFPESGNVDPQFDGVMSGVSGSYRVIEGDLLKIEMTSGLEKMTYDMVMRDTYHLIISFRIVLRYI